VENFKNPQQVFPIFALSIHTTFSQTQTGATVPLSQICAAILRNGRGKEARKHYSTVIHDKFLWPN
jgi:hypothetical protein